MLISIVNPSPIKPATTGAGPQPRRIVLCLDGTWNSTYVEKKRHERRDKVLKPSNVLKLCRSVVPWDEELGHEQVTYYDIGVGSLAEYPGVSNRLLHSADRILGGGWGAGFEENVGDALGFLVHNHRENDKVFIFGFSRGAATARAVTRFLDWSGGLPAKEDAYYLPIMFRAYVVSRGKRPFADVLETINAKRAGEVRPDPIGPMRPVRVEFLGVWDTVMALGSRFRAAGVSTSSASRSFHVGSKPARCVRHARQALAIDETRYDFRPEIWIGSESDQTLEQRWFTGVHSNVGGGYVDDGLANLAFHWILEGAIDHRLAVNREFAAVYRGFAQDRLYRSESLFYRILDGIRLRFGRGRRQLLGHPATARLTLDQSVVWRIQADPARFMELQGKKYRPRNVMQFLACQSALEAYLGNLGLQDRQLPDDVVKEISAFRESCPEPAQGALP